MSVIARLPFTNPLAEGVKVTLTWQLAPAASAPPTVQVVPEAIAKFGVTAIAEMINAVVPVLVSVTICAGLVLPTF